MYFWFSELYSIVCHLGSFIYLVLFFSLCPKIRKIYLVVGPSKVIIVDYTAQRLLCNVINPSRIRILYDVSQVVVCGFMGISLWSY